MAGHDPAYKSLLQTDRALANHLLDRFGDKNAKDGWRTLPDGAPLLVRYVSRNEASGVLQAEVWRKTYTAHQMARVIEVIGAARMGYARYRNMLAQPNVLGYRKPPILKQEWQYIDIGPAT